MPSTLIDLSGPVLARVEAAVAAADEAAAETLIERLRTKLREPKHGRTYRVSGKPSPHVASAPGEAPADWTHRLAEAIKSVPLPGGGQLVFVDDAEAEYAGRWLERGSPGGKVAPRPWFYPTVDEFAPEFEAMVGAAVAEALRG